MYWWHKAAQETLAGRTRRFGFITTNSIKQTFNRRVVQSALDEGIYLIFAIPDHPWIDATECAAVRIAMTVGALPVEVCLHASPTPPAKPTSKIASKLAPTPSPTGRLYEVTREIPDEETGEHSIQLSCDLGKVHADLTTGTDSARISPLKANEGIAHMGMKLHGMGFMVSKDEAATLGLGKTSELSNHIHPYLNGRDLTNNSRDALVIDLFGLSAAEVRERFPKVYEHILRTVKPERDQNKRATYRDRWWVFAEPRPLMREALNGLKRFIGTTETAKHRLFSFISGSVMPDQKIRVVASDDAFLLGTLSSRPHLVWSSLQGSTLEDRPVYVNSTCFDPFPFPDCTEAQKGRIRKLAEEIDAHRKRAQAQHGLGLTDIYNVLEKLRAAAMLTAKDKVILDDALVSTLLHLHQELDAAVADAYGWPWPLTDEEILERVVALNAARAAEEEDGNVRWLRPEYQIPRQKEGKPKDQSELGLTDAAGSKPSSGKKERPAKPSPVGPQAAQPKIAWPKSLAERAKAVESALSAATVPVTPSELAQRFARAKPADVAEILDTLVALGRARAGDMQGTFVR
ncbi:MAG TPA: hypothetical protein DCQ04_05585 [Actinobacteria bacterium]|nr:hypothetical protein [Actinomycetota bacterium]